VEELLFKEAPRFIKFALGENVTRANWQSNPLRYPSTRMGVESVYRRAFEEARRYMREWERYETERVINPKVIPPRRDLRLEALADILRGEIRVQCHSYRADEMLMMLRLAKEFDFKLAASSANAASLNCRRGWCGFGTISAMEISEGEVAVTVAGGCASGGIAWVAVPVRSVGNGL
jgi:imidazolonepropionase-like amidohydrolase